MIQRGHAYDVNQVTAILGSVNMSGAAAGEDAFLEFEPDAPIGELTVGGGGLPTFILDNNNVLRMTVTVMPHSRLYRLLAEAMDEQYEAMKATAQIPPLPFFMRDPSNGDVIEEPYCIFLERPMPNKQTKAVTEQVFVIALLNSADKIKRGTLNVV